MTFRFASSVDTIGPLQFELLVALVVAAGLARILALLVSTARASMRERGWSGLYAAGLAMTAGLVLLLLPVVLLDWLYGLTHPNAYVCTFIVWPTFLIPAGVYVCGLLSFDRRERLDGRTQLS